jgi:hypothetical protein
VVYIAANPPSPVPEEAEEEDAPPASEAMGCEAKIPSAFDAVSDNNITAVWCYKYHDL